MAFKISKASGGRLSVQAKSLEASGKGVSMQVADSAGLSSLADAVVRQNKKTGLLLPPATSTSPMTAQSQAGINTHRPEIISCFDFLPMYTDDTSGLTDAMQSNRLKGNKAEEVKRTLSTKTILPTVAAELADLQVQAMNLKMEAFKNEMSEFISQGTASTTLSLERMYDTTQQEVAANVITYYNIMYQAISAIEMSQDLKSYIIPTSDSISDPMGVLSYAGYYIPSEYTGYESRTILAGTTMADFFRDYLYFDPSVFSTFSNTKVYNQLLNDLNSIIQNADPSLLDQPAVELSRGAGVASLDPFKVDSNISKAFSPIKSALQRIVGIGTPSDFSYFGGEESEYTFQDYMDFISSLPSNPVKRISILSHFVNRDTVLKNNLSLPGWSSTTTTAFSQSGYDTSTFPESTNAEFTSAGIDSEVPIVPRFMAGSIKNVLGRAIGSPTGDVFSASGKTGASAVSLLTSTRDTVAGISKTVLPFESKENISSEKDYQSGLSFFTKNISDSPEESSSTTLTEFLSSMQNPFHYFAKGTRNYTQSITYGVNRILYGNQDLMPTTNLLFIKSILSELKSYFEERPAYGLDAAQLAILSMADDPDIGYRLARFMMNYKTHLSLPVGYAYPASAGPAPDTGTPTDAIGFTPSSASDPTSQNYRFYYESVLEYIHTVGARNEDLINSMIDLASAVHNKTAILSSQIDVPGYSSNGLLSDSESTFKSHFINTFERYKSYMPVGPARVYPTVHHSSPGKQGLASGWGYSLMLALNDPTCLFGRICKAVDNFIDTAHSRAQLGDTPYTSVNQQSTFQFRHIHMTMIATEICKELVEEYLPVKIANTGYEREFQPDTPGHAGDAAYYINKIRIDVYTTQIDSLVAALSSIPSLFEGPAVSSDPPIGGSESVTLEYTDAIKRSIYDIVGNLINQDTAITNIALVLRNIGLGLEAAAQKLNYCTHRLAGTIEQSVFEGDIDLALNDAAARALFQSIRRDTSNHTLSLLSPEQIQTMSAMYYSLSNSGDYNTLFPGGKILGPGDCKLTKEILQQAPFLADPGKRRKILTIGLPTKIVEELRLSLGFNALDEFGNEFFTNPYDESSEAMFGLGGSAALSKYSLIKLKVYKRNLKRDFSAYKPKTFLFDPGLFILPFQSDEAQVTSGASLLSLAKIAYFSKLSIMHEGGSLNLQAATGHMIKTAAHLSEALSDTARSIYPWTGEANDRASTRGTQLSIDAVGGKEQSDLMIEALIKNHLVNYGLRNYLKLVSDIDVSEHVFQFENKGFDSFPDPLTADIYSDFLDFISSRQKVGDSESARNIDYLRKLCEISYPFARENYRDRTVNAMSFDRVFNVLIDEDSFEEYELSDDDPGVPIGEGRVSSDPPTGGSSTPTFHFSADSGKVMVSKSKMSLDASYSDYFVTIELYQPVQHGPDFKDGMVDSEGYLGEDPAVDDDLSGGLFGGGSADDASILAPVETMTPDFVGEIYTDDPSLLDSGIASMIEKLQPMGMTKDYSQGIQDAFERSVVCPKFYGSMHEESEDYINNTVEMRSMLDEMIDTVMTQAGGAVDMSPTDMIQQIQTRAFEMFERTDSFETGVQNTQGSLASDMLVDTSGISDVDSMLRGFETQVGAAFSSGIDSIAGVDSGIFDTGLSSGLSGMSNMTALAAYEPAASLTDTQMSYGISYETMTSQQGLADMGSAISSGAGASAIESNLSMFEFHTSYTAGYQTSGMHGMTGLF